MDATATYAACLTPPGTGAIATLAVRGPEALRVVQTLFQARTDYSVLSTQYSSPALPFHLGKFGDTLADEVVLLVQRTEPTPWVELHCHGGREVVRLLLETLQRHGVIPCSWEQLERLTTADPLMAEATIRLAQATTVRTAGILLDQVHGAFARALEALEAALDDTPTVGRLLDDLARYVGVGRHLVEPWRVVVAGAPNVGKSSLVNALAGFQRSIVSPVPGTTRDVVAVSIALDGWPIELSDTAGLRGEADDLERQGMRLAEDAAAAADLCLWVLDGTTVLPNPAPRGPGLGGNVLSLINKADLPAGWDHAQFPHALRVSAVTGHGLAELCQAIAQRLVPEPPAPGAAVPFTSYLCEQIEHARQSGQLRQLLQEMRCFPGGRG